MQGKDLKGARTSFLYNELDESWRQWKPEQRGRAVKRVRSLPVEVRTEGLSTAIAVLLDNDREKRGDLGEAAGHHNQGIDVLLDNDREKRGDLVSRALANLLARWLLKSCPMQSLRTERGDDASALLDACVRADRPRYQAAQAETLALLDQLKILADALYGDEARLVSDD